MRRWSIILASLTIFAQTSGAFAQEAAPNLLREPLIAAVARVAPARASDLMRQLKVLEEGTRTGGSRTGPQQPATAAELQQIAANPSFAEAYRRYPNDALVLLRWAIETTDRFSVAQ